MWHDGIDQILADVTERDLWVLSWTFLGPNDMDITDILKALSKHFLEYSGLFNHLWFR